MSLAYKISGWNRGRKWQRFLDMIPLTAETRLLDVGFSDQEYSATDNFLEKHYPYLHQVTALTLDEPKEGRERYPAVNIIQYDGRVFPFADQSFDVCWSNAVIEHVGQVDAQVAFLKEIKRVAKVAYLTTPNRLFPVEVHTRTLLLHYLPKPLFDRYLHLIGKSWAAGDYMDLLSLRDVKQRLAAAGIQDYQILANTLLGVPLDFVIVFRADASVPLNLQPAVATVS